MFEPLHKLFNQIDALDIDNVMFDVWDGEDIQEIIIELNTIKQLFEQGIDSNGQSLGDYSPTTIKMKRADGLPYDRVTLRQDGIFYKSFNIIPESDGFIIDADPIKQSQDLTETYGEAIIGLTAESKEQLIKAIIPTVINEIYLRITRR